MLGYTGWDTAESEPSASGTVVVLGNAEGGLWAAGTGTDLFAGVCRSAATMECSPTCAVAEYLLYYACEGCPAHTSSDEGSTAVTDCVCVAGYTAGENGVACTACDAGTYKTVTGAVACSACPSQTSSAGASDALTDCVCVVGHTASANGEACTACEAGKYKATTGSGSCTACPSQTSSAGGSDALTDCVCVAGYTAASDGDACTACEAGEYKVATGVGDCSTCPAGTSSASGSDALADCECEAGYSGASDGEVCTACVADTYKSATGVGDCSDCPASTTTSSAEGSELTDCVCIAGHTASADGEACTACVAGTYKAATGSASCTACEAGYQDAAGQVLLSSWFLLSSLESDTKVCEP